MKDERPPKKENVILFPGLVTKLVEKGMTALKEKKHKEALEFFLQTLELEEEHPQGRLGVVLSYIELGMLQEAVEQSEEMLNQDIGDYYDVLQIHISLLIQLGQYQEVVAILEVVLAEDKIPSNYAESFYQLLHFSRQMSEDAITEEGNDVDDKAVEEAKKLLHSKDPASQWKGVQKLRNLNTDDVKDVLIAYLNDNENDLLIKSYVLQMIKEKKVDKLVKVVKLGKSLEINPIELPDFEENKFGIEVTKLLEEELENDNPTMLVIALELWWQYLFALFPLQPEPSNNKFWAAVIHIAALDSHSMDFDELEIAKTYQVNVKEVLHKVSEVINIQEQLFQVIER